MTSAAERGPKTSQPLRPEAPPSKPVRPSSGSGAALAEPYCEARASVWCGLHALNNYLGGPCVCTMLSQAGDGGSELPTWHLNPDDGRLSIEATMYWGPRSA